VGSYLLPVGYPILDGRVGSFSDLTSPSVFSLSSGWADTKPNRFQTKPNGLFLPSYCINPQRPASTIALGTHEVLILSRTSCHERSLIATRRHYNTTKHKPFLFIHIQGRNRESTARYHGPMSTVSLPLYAHVHTLALYVTWLQDRQPNATGLDGRVRCRVAAHRGSRMSR
jgi:hypothetical protein